MHTIEQLSNWQAESILDSLVAEYGNADLPVTVEEQKKVLDALLHRLKPSAAGVSEQLAVLNRSDGARAVLAIMAEVPELNDGLLEALRDPPRRETAASVKRVANAVTLAGCLVALQVAGHTSVTYKDGHFEIGIDPFREGPLDRLLARICDIVLLPPSGTNPAHLDAK